MHVTGTDPMLNEDEIVALSIRSLINSIKQWMLAVIYRFKPYNGIKHMAHTIKFIGQQASSDDYDSSSMSHLLIIWYNKVNFRVLKHVRGLVM